ncbi:fumarylacetoacetate hydrolase family protein [Peribacillus castrilensis]|uniref:4-hydroxyphenylacetate degradation bifunctional isomerase/decarboxylase subunit HpaG2 n=1 Tax=Peribacillus simplex TaxID=1478 RepID=A0AAN2PHT1_9BACI|nr:MULTISPECIES: fumarylacetoacetate hydrolase family protein [Bacillaceae]MCP1094617.1 fumarylacetoacetate hydrolase family protein [Bacillaceae bacterium OS4b]MBD8588945.1 fumarylacetoacetate hydrolase family protein [Peribacillus simplex]MCF7622848.1 fumarylacetoacetate hydrolase family protein [Peribacillus frigoritolerans]MCP1153393.1 fumarylacetoacetate hydrolase family protein [Peribacillus frigoritolerans]MCT1389061.1 fumarylacetoacetate hydrolase family protein [Peribacillus frigorito
MRIIRYVHENKKQLAAVTNENNVVDLPFTDFMSLITTARCENRTAFDIVKQIVAEGEKQPLEGLQLTTPIDAPEVWASGVTYKKSKEARNYEATQGKLDRQTFYDKVYDAVRPEIFFKSTAARTVGPNDPVYLRSDSKWQIPEPELGLVIDKKGTVLGYIAGNDMSCRDIEGENPLYLPQAKVWKNSCSIGPAILLKEAVPDPYELKIMCRIFRNEEKVFEGEAKVNQLKRKLEELVDYLVLDNTVFDGSVLLTGTCVVPPNEFTLKGDDRIEIEIPGIGVLNNPVIQSKAVQTI